MTKCPNPRLNRSKVSLIHREQTLNLQTLCRRHNACVCEADRQGAILENKFPAPDQVFGGRSDEGECAGFNALQEIHRRVDS